MRKRRSDAVAFEVGVRVLVCGDLFDASAPYQQQAGLGGSVDVGPPSQTVFFSGTVLRYIDDLGEYEVRFDTDKAKVNVKPDQIYRKAVGDEGQDVFYVFREDTGYRLHKTTGILYEKGGDREIAMPQRFHFNVVPPGIKPRVALRPAVRAARHLIPTDDLAEATALTQSNTVSVSNDSETPPPRQRRRTRAPSQLRRQPRTTTPGPLDGSDNDDLLRITELDDANDSADTDSGHESESSHDTDDEYAVKYATGWERELRAKPHLAPYDNIVWKIPKRRDAVPDVFPNVPGQSSSFMVDLSDEGRPLAALFLDALPVTQFWKKVVAQTLLYAEQQAELPATPTNRRPWRPDVCTVSNLLRVVCCVIFRGVVNTADTPSAFAGVDKPDYKRTGCAIFCGITLTNYQQLMRYLHVTDTTKRPVVNDDDHDKLYHVRPLITRLQAKFKQWCRPGKNQAMDEAGIPSRFTWLRKRDDSKPHRFFIEILMACNSDNKFCWHFFVTEGVHKSVLRVPRPRGKSKLKQIPHYQYEYNADDRLVYDQHGATVAQMFHFARVLRSMDPDPGMVYNFFADKRWGSIPGAVLTTKRCKCTFTGTVKAGWRYHCCYHLGVVKSKKREHRGKYRSATTKIAGVTVNTCQWNDSTLVGYFSTAFGSKQCEDTRQQGRHKIKIAIPQMALVRGQHFRAVDQNDQLRLGKAGFNFVCRTKAWPKVFWGCIELLVVNMYIIARTNELHTEQRAFRWELMRQLLAEADDLDKDEAGEGRGPTTPQTPAEWKTRFHPDSATMHHHSSLQEYILAEDEAAVRAQMAANPARRTSEPRPRARDLNRNCRLTGKPLVRNPMWIESQCIVCWAGGKRPRGGGGMTAKYCEECSWDTTWNKKSRSGGYTYDHQPRLCSEACWTKFHTERISGLDFNKRRSRNASGRAGRR
jgi:hypothetical protein